MVATVGLRQAEMALMTGKLYNADEAAKIGLVDEVVENKEEAENFFRTYGYYPHTYGYGVPHHYGRAYHPYPYGWNGEESNET